jgi:hypothetical protein
MPSIAIGDLGEHIRRRSAEYDRAWQAELSKLKRTFGKPAVEEALAIVRRDEQPAELRAALSISGTRKR